MYLNTANSFIVTYWVHGIQIIKKGSRKKAALMNGPDAVFGKGIF
jgi:hypothetical protein